MKKSEATFLSLFTLHPSLFNVFFASMEEPEYLICLECETPTYLFEFGANGKLLSVICNTCGNDSPSEFMTENELEEHSGA
ncbi:MAG: hypothetical protein JO088_15880 [Acidobacteria bacterium]|nr:hypothetical protein [Acidobacteriota bacterium]